jgi:hypothetical protein
MSRRHGVDADVAESLQLISRVEPDKTAQASSCNVLEEHALDRVLRTKAQDLVLGRVDDPRGHS